MDDDKIDFPNVRRDLTTFARKYPELIDWHWVSHNNEWLTEEMIDEFSAYVDWEVLSRRYPLTETLVLEHFDQLEVQDILDSPNLSDDFKVMLKMKGMV
jgi:hypothetical protein